MKAPWLGAEVVVRIGGVGFLPMLVCVPIADSTREDARRRACILAHLTAPLYLEERKEG